MAADCKSNCGSATTATTQQKAEHDNSKDDEARLKEILIKKKVMQKVKNRRESGNAAAAADTIPSENGKSKDGELELPKPASGSDNENDNDQKKESDKEINYEEKNGHVNRRDKHQSHHHLSHGPRSPRQTDRDHRDRFDQWGGESNSRKNDGHGKGDGPFPRDDDYSRDNYRGDQYHYRSDPYGRGGDPPPHSRRDYYDDRRGGRNGGRGWRGGWPGGTASRAYDDRWDGTGPRGGDRGRYPTGRRDERERDIYGRNAGPSPPPLPQRGSGGSRGESPERKENRSHSISSRSYSRSQSRSRSNSTKSDRSRSRSRSYSSRSSHSRSSSSRSVSRSHSRSPSRSSANRKRGGGSNHHSHDKKRMKGRRSSCSTSPHSTDVDEVAVLVDEATKDQRTIFVSQLVMRAEERDISRYFKRSIGIKVRDVILLRDRRTGRHKGCAYVELGSLEDVERALKATGKTPDFQRFPILVKRTEAEKNGLTMATVASAGLGIQFTPPVSSSSYQLTPDGRRIEAQKVYIGSIDPCVTQAQLYALFSQFGPLDKVLLQIDVATGMSRGFAFLSYRDPKDANLAIQTMSGQMLVGRPLKTGWANQQASAAGVVEVKTDQFPDDANEKIQKVNAVLTQLTGTSLTTMIGQVDPAAHQALLAAGPAGALGIMPSAQLASVANAALDMALGVTPTTATAVDDAKVVGRSNEPTPHILVHNMFNKDEETDPGWENDIKLDFEEECAKYGKITRVVVMSKDPGGMIYASFDSMESATNCAKNLAGRWFDKRQLRVEFVDTVPDS